MHDLRARLSRLGAQGPGSSDNDLNPPGAFPDPGRVRGAAVLVPVWARPDGPRLILTKRSTALSQHPGQIAFPGGKIDPGDADATAAALREAEEEIGLDRSAVRVLGRLPVHHTITAYEITPVLGWIDGDFTPRAEPGEVAEVFTVPMAHVLDPRSFSVQSRDWRGKERRFYAAPYGPYYIWGATARILKMLCDRMAA